MGVVLVSWNVHGWVGADRVRDPERSFAAIAGFGADVVALQEVEGYDWTSHAERLGYRPLAGYDQPTSFGNALLLRVPLLRSRRLDLSIPGRERRTALDAVVQHAGGPLRVVATHLGLRAFERRQQAARLAQHLEARDAELPVALLGDLNDWTPWARQLAPLARAVGPLSRIPTFPSRRPVLSLDRAACRGFASRVSAIRDAAVRRASDHLPLRVEIE